MPPSNSKRGFIAVKFKDGEKKLCFTTNALVEAEELLGKSVSGLFSGTEAELLRNFGFREIRILLWAGIRGAGSKWSVKGVGSQMETKNFVHYAQAVSEGIALAMNGGEVDDEEPEELDPTDPPGTQSSPVE